MKSLKALTLLLCVIILSACGGSGGGGAVGGSTLYRFEAVGGTLNDGTAANGLVVLATLRDSNGTGPGLNGGWNITITGPGISTPLSVPYRDGSASSYASWQWKGVIPGTGKYTATATNGTAILTSSFNVSASSILPQPALSRVSDVVSWNAVTGAGSYYYQVTDGFGAIAQSGYLDASASPSFQLKTLPDGSYVIAVSAQTKSRVDLMNDKSAAPLLPAQENASVSTLNFTTVAGSPGSYNLSASGGVLYMGQQSGVDQYGLVVWSSILTNAVPGSPTAFDWTISVTGPGIDSSAPIVFTYPKTDSHFVHWDFGTLPAAGTYTATATASGSTEILSTQFTIADPTAKLPVVTGIAVASAPNGYTVNWNAVPGAGSYYLNLWAVVGGTYTEVASTWISGSTLTADIPKTSLTKGTLYDVYVTACSADMTTMNAVPPPAPSQVNMSDNTFASGSFTAQ
jgi:hypothetical protein